MLSFVTELIPYAVLFAHVLFVLLVAAMFYRHAWGRPFTDFLGKHALLLGFLASAGAIVGSLFYSNVVGFEACVLCWWQRIFLYPLAPIFALALSRKDRGVFGYAAVLAGLAAVVAGYQAFANFTGKSLLSCTAAEGACSKIFVLEFGYITIPVMSLTIAAYILLLAWANRIFNEDRNS